MCEVGSAHDMAKHFLQFILKVIEAQLGINKATHRICLDIYD